MRRGTRADRSADRELRRATALGRQRSDHALDPSSRSGSLHQQRDAIARHDPKCDRDHLAPGPRWTDSSPEPPRRPSCATSPRRPPSRPAPHRPPTHQPVGGDAAARRSPVGSRSVDERRVVLPAARQLGLAVSASLFLPSASSAASRCALSCNAACTVGAGRPRVGDLTLGQVPEHAERHRGAPGVGPRAQGSTGSRPRCPASPPGRLYCPQSLLHCPTPTAPARDVQRHPVVQPAGEAISETRAHRVNARSKASSAASDAAVTSPTSTARDATRRSCVAL